MQTATTPKDHFTVRVTMDTQEMESRVLVSTVSVLLWDSFIFLRYPGYKVFFQLLSDVNECLPSLISEPYRHLTHNCHADANCTNTNGSFYCACLTGYSGDGVMWSLNVLISAYSRFFSISCFYGSAVLAHFPLFCQYVYLTFYEKVNVKRKQWS